MRSVGGWRAVGALALLPGLAVTAACGAAVDPGSTADPAPTTTTTSALAGSVAPLQLRVVVATDDSPAPDSAALQAFGDLDCDTASSATPSTPPHRVRVTRQVAACDTSGTKYLLGPAFAVGGVTSATAVPPPAGASWAVEVTLDDDTTAALAATTRRLAPAGQQVALLLDDEVVSAPRIASAVLDGDLEVTGTFSEADAEALAAALRAGG